MSDPGETAARRAIDAGDWQTARDLFETLTRSAATVGFARRTPLTSVREQSPRRTCRASTERARRRIGRKEGPTGVAQDEDALPELFAAIGPSVRPDRAMAVRARRLLDDPEQRLTVSALAHALNVHPVHLTRQFRQTYGVSLREYRTIQLVRRAATLVLGTKAPLSRIAHECGFADQSHMCRAFRRVAGWSPSRRRAS
jgi:AraC-like DNA-binding protein